MTDINKTMGITVNLQVLHKNVFLFKCIYYFYFFNDNFNSNNILNVTYSGSYAIDHINLKY